MSMLKNGLDAAQLALFEVLPDARRRLTRYRVLNLAEKVDDSLILAWGTVDPAPADAPHNTEDFAGLRLIRQFTAEPGSIPAVSRDKPVWVQVYEQLHATAEIQVGQNTRIKLEDGREAIEAEFLQLSSGTFIPGTVGATTAPGDTSAFLQRVEQTNDGTLRRIKRTYVYAGTLDQTDETDNDGKLLRRTIVSVKTEPATPAGYSLVRQERKNVNGLPVYTYTFAKGEGEADRATQYGQSDDAGTTGSTTITITHLTASSVSVDPTSSPGAGFVKVLERRRDEAGHRVWTVAWAKGTGTVVTEVRTAEGGKIVLYHRVGLGSAPSAPSATIGGTVTNTVANVSKAEGYAIHDYTWVEGLGETSRAIDYLQSSDQGTTGATRTTIRHVVAPGGTVQPTSLSGSVEVGRDYTDEAGYRVWITRWAKGQGMVVDDQQTRHNGKLILTHRVALGAAPATPAPSIGGTVTIIEANERAQEGYLLYDRWYAEGEGIIAESSQPREGGLRLLHREILLAPGDTDISPYEPADGILSDLDYEELDGCTRWSAVWTQKSDGSDPLTGTALEWTSNAEFRYPGRARVSTQGFLIGAYTSHRARDVLLSSPVSCLVPATTKVSYQASDTLPALAHTLWNPTEWAHLRAQWTAWAEAPRSKNEGLRDFRAVGFDVTGVASTDVLTVTGHNWSAEDYVYFSVLNGGSGLAVDTIYYLRDIVGSTFKLSATLGGAAINVTTDITAGSVIHLLGGRSFTGTDQSVFGDRCFTASEWRIELKGGPPDPGGSTWTLSAELEPAFVGYDGTPYYRVTIVESAIPAQSALPV